MTALSKKIQAEYIEHFKAHEEENRRGALRIEENYKNSNFWDGERFFSHGIHIPKTYEEKTIKHFQEIVTMTYGIVTKVIRAYLEQPEYRKLFPFSKELEELILVPNGYDSLLPIACFDIFYDEDTEDFKFCEINTDGTSGMNEYTQNDRFYKDNYTHQYMKKKYDLRSFELFGSWIDCFMGLYGTYDKRIEKPQVAIVDFLDKALLGDFEGFAKRFEKRGIPCRICDIRDLRYDGSSLSAADGYRIDAIYRRAVTTDIMEDFDRVQPLIQAVTDRNIFMAGSFCTQIPHNKWLFYLLHREETHKLLSEEEIAFVERHIPKTFLLADGQCDRELILNDKDGYLLKPLDSYGCAGLYAGVECSGQEWQRAVDACWGKDYICQEYCKQYRTLNADFLFGDGKVHPFINMTRLFVYNGVFAGVYGRFAQGDTITTGKNERMAPAYVIGKTE